jgi:hypothetical protein
VRRLNYFMEIFHQKLDFSEPLGTEPDFSIQFREVRFLFTIDAMIKFNADLIDLIVIKFLLFTI